jgi:3-oxoadipate enol-lactonase
MSPLAYSLDDPTGAPVLVMSSSLGTTRDMWLPQLAALTREWRVLRFDHPGHGDSPVWDERVSVKGIGGSAVDLLDRLGFDRVSFCGLSLGGAVGQWLAAHAPERIERLILCSTSADFAAHEVYLQRAAIVRERGMAAISHAVLERWFTPEFRARQPETVARYRAMLEAIPPAGYAACCKAVAEFDGKPDLPSIAAPTLVIAGAEDPATTIDHAERLRDGIRGARLVTIAHAAHMVNVEQPGAVTNAIHKFLTMPLEGA